jgi:membrane protease YdiL (CAAX protease family)
MGRTVLRRPGASQWPAKGEWGSDAWKDEATDLHGATLILLASPFYLNDFANLFVTDWRLWLWIDYVGVKLFPLVIVMALIRRHKLRPADIGLTTQRLPAFLAVFLGVTLIGTVIDQNGSPLLSGLPGYAALGSMPEITSPLWNWMDLSLGLLAVGFMEELVFRGCMLAFLKRYTASSLAIVVISSVAFGLIHWSNGLHAVLVTSVIGAVFMTVYLKTRSLPAIMLAHFAINFIDFAGVIPKAIFRLV